MSPIIGFNIELPMKLKEHGHISFKIKYLDYKNNLTNTQYTVKTVTDLQFCVQDHNVPLEGTQVYGVPSERSFYHRK